MKNKEELKTLKEGCGELTEDKKVNQWFRCGRKDYKTKKVLLCPECKKKKENYKIIIPRVQICGIGSYV